MSLNEIRGGARRWPQSDRVAARDLESKDIQQIACPSCLIQPGRNKRVVLKIHVPSAAYFGANAFRVIGPRFEADTKRMHHQDLFGLWVCGVTLCLCREQ